MSSTPFIEMKDVAFAYGDRPILNNINFSIPQGNFAAVMGGSGSGKTTLMRLITGQIHPQSGKVLIEGRDLAAFSAQELYEHRRRMGVLFQHGALFTDLSVFDNIAFPMRELTDLPEAVIRDLVVLKLNAVGLRGVENLMPSELSGGMSRRVALARTIALDPEIMLYDEPFTGLDPISLGVIAHLISRANKALRSTSVMVTHDIENRWKLSIKSFSWHTAKSCSPARPKKCANSTRLGYASLSAVWQTALSPTAIRRKRL